MVDAHGVIRILDFGIARVANSGMTSDGALIGTLNYMSPEQMLGRPVDFRSDIFSVGAVAYELLSYHQAFPGALDDGLLHRLPQMAPTPLASVCPGLPDRPGSDRAARAGEGAARALRGSRGDAKRRSPPAARPGPASRGRDDRHPVARQAEAVDAPGLVRGATRAARAARPSDRACIATPHAPRWHEAISRAAAAACDDALTLDPDDADASLLLDRVRDAATAAGYEPSRHAQRRVRCPTSGGARGHAIGTPGRDAKKPSPRLCRRSRRRARDWRWCRVWMINSDQTPAPTPTTETVSSRRPRACSGRADSPRPQWWCSRHLHGSAPVAQAPAPVTAAPAPTAAPATVDALAAPLARINQLHQAGDVAGALADLARIGSTNDARVSTLARSVAQSAFRSMDASLAAAIGQKAADLAPASYTAAEQARRLADAASSRNDHVESGTRALAASAAYRKAESDARAAAAVAAAKTHREPSAELIRLQNPSLRRRREPRRQLLRRIPRRQQPRARARSTPSGQRF